MASAVWAQCLLSAAFGAAGVFLAYHQREGWGWLLFLAVLALPGWRWEGRPRRDDG